jgi:hypothetical protein
MVFMFGSPTYLYACLHMNLPPSLGILLTGDNSCFCLLRLCQLNPGHIVGMYIIPFCLQYAASFAIVPLKNTSKSAALLKTPTCHGWIASNDSKIVFHSGSFLVLAPCVRHAYGTPPMRKTLYLPAAGDVSQSTRFCIPDVSVTFICPNPMPHICSTGSPFCTM